MKHHAGAANADEKRSFHHEQLHTQIKNTLHLHRSYLVMASKPTSTFTIIWSSVFTLEALIWAFQRIIIQQSESVPFFILLSVWAATVPFFLLSLIHTFVLLPIVTVRRKQTPYILLTVTAYILFAAYTLTFGAPRPPHNPRFEDDRHTHLPVPSHHPDADRDGIPDGHKRPRPVGPAVLNLMAALLILGADASIAFHFKSVHEQKRMAQLETENLKYRLDYLRYQINPHFLMNTLNNIHALVDIDSEKAKDSIIELSKLMRHILYDSGSATVPLKTEIDFLNHYIALMKLRFKEDARIETDFPEETETAEIPPIILVTIVENAFKHGFGTSDDSFIKTSSKIEDDRLIFHCVNSVIPDNSFSDTSHGVGLENVKKRLELIYGDDFEMDAGQNGDVYSFHLSIPSHPIGQVEV